MSNTVFKPLASRTGLPFALLGNRTSASSFDFNKPFDLPVEITFTASRSTSAVAADMPSPSPPPTPPLFQCCAHLPLYVSAVFWKSKTKLELKRLLLLLPPLIFWCSKSCLYWSPLRSVSLYNCILRFKLLEVISLIYTSTGMAWFAQLSFTAFTYSGAA